MTLIAIEANIGAGKSTLIGKLALEIGFKHIQEPVDDPEFLRLLKEFTTYPNDSKVRLNFQRYITESRANLLKSIPAGNYIIERSLFSDLVFCQANMLSTERPDGSYISYYYDILDRLKDYPQVDAIVYLKTQPELAYQRMLARARKEEAGTKLAYLQDIHRFHEACLPQICREYHSKLLTFNWDHFGQPQVIAQKLREEGII